MDELKALMRVKYVPKIYHQELLWLVQKFDLEARIHREWIACSYLIQGGVEQGYLFQEDYSQVF